VISSRAIAWHVVTPTRPAVAVVVLAGSALIALAAQLRIDLPFSPVPVTGQTFAVLVVGAALGARLGAAAVIAYLVEGLAGLPVFAGGTSAWTPGTTGIPVIAGPTAGYLVGFVAAAAIVGALAERGFDRNVVTTIVAMVLGDLAIYVFGLPWLAKFVGIDKAIPLGLQPFIVGDLFKIALAAAALPLAWRALRR
jgi:biotin transport system substrate-specific component